MGLTGRRPRPPLRPARRPRRPGGRAASACCTSAASSTIRRACCGPCATRPGWASAWTPDTERWRATRRAGGALRTVSGARVRDELMDMLGELDAPPRSRRMHELGVDRALHRRSRPTPSWWPRRRSARWRWAPTARWPRWRPCVAGAPQKLDLWLADLHLDAGERDAVCARRARWRRGSRRAARASDQQPSELRDLLRPRAAGARWPWRWPWARPPSRSCAG